MFYKRFKLDGLFFSNGHRGFIEIRDSRKSHDQILFVSNTRAVWRKEPFTERCCRKPAFPKRRERGYEEGSVMVHRKTNKRYAPRDYGGPTYSKQCKSV